MSRPRPATRAAVPVALALVGVLVAACGGAATPPPSPTPMATVAPPTATPAPSATPAPTATPTPAPAVLPADPAAAVVALVGDETVAAWLTDWARIRGATAVPDDAAARFDLIQGLDDRAPAVAFGVRRFASHREAWGWDTLDLAWEASIEGGGPPLAILALGPNVDLAPILARFRDRGFGEEVRGPATVFSKELDPGADWIGTTDLAIHNTAVLAEARLLVLSSSRERLDVALDRLVGPAATPGPRAAAAAAVLAALRDVDAAGLLLDPEACADVAPAADPDLAAVAAGLHPWLALGAGWRSGDDGASGRYAVVHADAATAAADLAGRERLAREGPATSIGQPFAEAVATVTAATTEGSLVLVDVVPSGPVSRLLASLLRRDVPFAACGG